MNDRRMQQERNDTDERVKTKKDERLLRSSAVSIQAIE